MAQRNMASPHVRKAAAEKAEQAAEAPVEPAAEESAGADETSTAEVPATPEPAEDGDQADQPGDGEGAPV